MRYKQLWICLFCALLLCVVGCGERSYPEPDENTVCIIVSFHTDDIYEIGMERYLNGESFGGQGMSNADRSRLGYTRLGRPQEDPWEAFLLETGDFGDSADLSTFSMKLYVRNAPLESVNWEDPFGESVEVPDMLTFPVAYGHIYRVELTGSLEDGYTARYVGEITEE